MPHSEANAVDVTPSAKRLTSSLRDIGYDFVAALADIVDNSVAASATQVDIEVVFDGPRSYVLIADNGNGMADSQLMEALRFGSRRSYALGDLGRYGLGLKTASISQGRRLSVVSRRSPTRRRLSARSLDLDHIDRTDRWEIIDPPSGSRAYRSLEWLNSSSGTVVLWEILDRVLPESRPEGGWARRRLESLAAKATSYLGMVFHRFIEGDAERSLPLTITVNGEKVPAWNPFAPMEEHRIELPRQEFEVAVGDQSGKVQLRRFVLPPRNRFSSQSEFDRLSGPLKWNRQQGLYIYRADRLIQHGGWSGVRSVDEHTKFARAAVDFQTDLDTLFQINVAKMRVALPVEVRTLLERPIHELCHRADAVYRHETADDDRDRDDARTVAGEGEESAAPEIGAALISAALDVGEQNALVKIMDSMRKTAPSIASSLGW